MMCAIALERACELAASGLVPDSHRKRWGQERKRIREFVEARGYSERKRAYVQRAGRDDLDASLLLPILSGYDDPHTARFLATVQAIRAELGHGALLHRYFSEDGLPGGEGFFIACSFWLAEAYARQGRLDEADALMVELVPLANDVGLFAEEIDLTGEFLGNFPQALSHLALVNAAVSIEKAQA